jgi:hypothetical protein
VNGEDRQFDGTTNDGEQEILVNVRRQWDDWRSGTVRLQDLSGFHLSDQSGGVMRRAPRKFVHAYMSCEALVEGEIGHSCRHGPPPHTIKVCITKGDNNAITYDQIRLIADNAKRQKESDGLRAAIAWIKTGWSLQLIRCLQSNGFHIPDAVLRVEPEVLRRLRGLGPKRMAQLEEYRQRHRTGP